MKQERKVILYIAMSLDGYIATETGSIDFLSAVEKDGEDYGYSAFIETVDTVIMGRKTYDKIRSFDIPFPHADKTCYVLTHTAKPSENDVHFYSGNIRSLIAFIKEQEGGNIFIDGGASVVTAMFKDNLIEECILSIIPVMLGGGIALFKDGRPSQNLSLKKSQAFDTGLVQLHYVLSE